MTHFLSSCTWRVGLVSLLLLFFAPRLFSQCSPDMTPPTVACLNGIELSLMPQTGQVQLNAVDVASTFTDDCCVGFLKIRRETDGPCDADGLPDAFADNIVFCCADAGAGPIAVVLRGEDCSGNFNECTTTITILPDVTPPVVVSPLMTTIAIGLDDPNDCYGPAGPDNLPEAIPGGGIRWIKADAFDDGSYDVCNNIKFTIRRQAPYSDAILGLNSTNGHLPCEDFFPDFPSEFERAIAEQDSIKFYCGEVGSTQTVILRAYQVDANGNFMLDGFNNPIFSEVTTEVEVVDKIKPVCPANVTVSCEDFDHSLAAYGPTDNCCLDTIITLNIDSSLYHVGCSWGVLSRSFDVLDCSGNFIHCSQNIEIVYAQNYFIRFPDDVITFNADPTGFYGEPVFFGQDCEALAFNYVDLVIQIDTATYKIRREWTIVNWCGGGNEVEVPNPEPNSIFGHPDNLAGPIVSQAGTPDPWAPTLSNIEPSDPAPTDFSTFWDSDAIVYRYFQNIRIIDTFFVRVKGKVFADTMANCSYDAGEPLLQPWKVKATGQVTNTVVEVLSDANGEYLIEMDGFDTLVAITLITPVNFGQNCQTVYFVPVAVQQTATQDVPVQLEQSCDLLSVGIATPRLRRCFPNTYTVQACNLSDKSIPGVYVEVELDDFFLYTNSSVPGTWVAGNTYSFDVGELAPAQCTTFQINFTLSCDAELGATHCTEAHVFPVDDCLGEPGWSGADVEVSAVCDGDSIRLTIANVGTGNMTQINDFVVVEDVIMREQGSFQLGVGQIMEISQPANGSTWRLEAEEEPLHPWGGLQATSLEGCGGINNFGLVNIFALSDPNPFETFDCQQNTGSYDPNDKQGFPLGFGNEHYIEANTDIEYLIRFQNTGTDTAFTVVVLDTLSQYLDPASVRIGVASHPMEFGLLEGGILRFTFSDILLPDSNINVAASNGFVKFRVAQTPDLAVETHIENRAAIYFDFNDPVFTNTTFHTIGDHFILVSTDYLENDGLLRTYPNPASDAVFFELKSWANAGRFELSNNLGQQVAAERFTGKSFRFERRNLPAGIYHFQILSNNTKTANGKIILK